MRDRVSKRKTRYRLRLKVEAIEAARREAGWTQEEFAEEAGFSVGRYREILRATRQGGSTEVGTGFIASILSALGWRMSDAVEQVVEQQ